MGQMKLMKTADPVCLLLCTLFISVLWSLVLLVSGCIVRFFTVILLWDLVESSRKFVTAHKAFAKNGVGLHLMPLLTDVKDMPDVGDWVFVFGSVMISNGSLTLLYAVLGYLAVTRDIKIFLALDIVLLFICIALLIYLLQIAYNPFFGFHEIAKNQLTVKLLYHYTIESDNVGFTAMMNSIMLLKECCGIRGPADFRNITYFESTFTFSDPYYFMVPPACCKSSLYENGVDRQIYMKLVGCAQKGLDDVRHVNTKGCYDESLKDVQSLHGGWLTTALILMILLSASQIALVILALLSSPASPQHALAASPIKVQKKDVEVEAHILSPEKQREEITRPTYVIQDGPIKVILKKPFKPYSAVSDYPQSDLRKIRSTEIW